MRLAPDLFGHLPDDPVPTRRSRTSNNPFSRNSNATARGRRVNDLLLSYLRKLTDHGCDAVAAATRAAELEVDAEDVRQRRAAGTAQIDEVVKAERLARHAKRELAQFGFERAARPKRSLADKLREKAAQSNMATSA